MAIAIITDQSDIWYLQNMLTSLGRATVILTLTLSFPQVIGIFAGFGILLLVASPVLLVAAPCIICCKCR